ncbi:MAG TPA: HEAT repeat domain-containing protein, partial [Verrucomicrobiae bacterium]|nr:HEAT repeat domain-containing protein [Verrucomicrobiae bacterium]
PKLKLETAAGCAQALQSPNLSTRYLAWNALRQMQSKGRRELLKLWSPAKNDPILRSRALYLLAQMNGEAGKYINQALKDPNPDLRITGLRIAREHKLDVIPYVAGLIHDPSPQVRRECAIALRHNPSPEAPKLWTALAQQHDGKDRWYLEALGIGADRQENKFFDVWRAAAGDNWDTVAGRDIIWRSRATNSLPLLVKIIASTGTPEGERPRYFRALDFIQSPEKNAALIQLLLTTFQTSGAPVLAAPVRNAISLEVLNRLKNINVEANPALKSTLLKALDATRGTTDFVELVRNFHLQGQNQGLLQIALQHPSDQSGSEAIKLVLESRDLALLDDSLRAAASAPKLVQVLGIIGDGRIVPILQPIITDTNRDVALRRQAVRALCQNQKGAAELLQLAQESKLPADLKLTAAMELNRVRWPELKARAALLLPAPQLRNAEPLPPVTELLKQKGDAAHGAQVFSRPEVNCISCHRVNDQGVDFGPGLSEIGDKLGKDALYEAILDPSAGIAFGYEAWQLELKSGDEAYGIIVSETADELTIKDPKAIATRIKKSDITKRQQLKTSIMPAGLQQTMSTQDLVDLVEYLSSLKKAAK